jgi:Na+-translocating ferredoxin:NAD+ oxidoreductase RNF subunit RnfB
MDMNILWAILWFAVIGGSLGFLLAFASKLFAVKIDSRTEKIVELLPGANCGGCSYAGCAALAEAITVGTAPTNACTVAKQDIIDEISMVMGVDPKPAIRLRAQVMCSGSNVLAGKKYDFSGPKDCLTVERFGGGDKMCNNGCIGLGTCAAVCKFGAIEISEGIAYVNYKKCVGCGTCAKVCPKKIIKLIPYDSAHWVGCMSVDNSKNTRLKCEVGCISCGLCAKNCEQNAIHINNFVASIEYDKCIDCGLCIAKCPRKIIWSGKNHTRGPIQAYEIDKSV